MAKRMKKIGSCIVIAAILMCVSGTVFAGGSGDNAAKASNRLDSLEEKFTGHNTSEGGIPFFTNNTIGKSRAATIGDCVGILDASIPMVYLNATQDSVASQDSGNVIILSDISNDTHETVNVTSCTVYVAIDDDTCVGYEVYLDGVYQFTEGQGKTPDGFCSFYVTEGTHTLEIRKNGCAASKTHNFLCGVSYTWVSMPDYWCEGGGGDCDNPPTVYFDETSYYEGDKVQITVSTIHSSVYYEIKDCSGTVRKTGYTCGGTISYTIPDGSTSSCCYWTICFYWDEGGGPIGPAEAGGNVTTESYQCTKCYNFYVCPDTCDAYVEIEDKVCFGYEVYVDGVLQFTEGQGTTPDGYCAFTVSEGYHTIEIRKDGCSEIVYSYYYFQCNGQYKKILQNYWCDCNKADLIIQDIAWSPNSPELEDTVTFTVTVKNIGVGTADQSTVKYYINNQYVDLDTIPSLNPGATSTKTFTWTANSCGNVIVKAIADANHEVQECDETNNVKQESIEIDGPDLIILDITWPTGPVCLDTPVTVTVKVKNQGDCTAGASTVKYYVDNNYVGYDSIPVLGSGATSTQTFTWTASSCGNVPVKAVADANNDVKECYEYNNEKQKDIEIDGPDLIIQDIILPTGPVCLDTPVTLTVKVKNQGDCLAGASTVKYYVDNKYVGSDTISSLSSGATSTQTFTWTASSCGNVPVKAVADANNAVHECDETNNEKQKSIEVDGPDLIILDVTWPTGPVCLDTPVTVTVKVRNQGDCTAGASTVKYYVDNKYVGSDTISSLSSGATSTQTFTWTASNCGNVPVKAIADANNAVHECDETNNEKQKSIEVDGPDLIIQDITWPTGPVCLDKPVTVTVKVKNQGDCTAGSFTVKYYVDNQYNGSYTISSLKYGSTSTQTFSWTPDTCGNHNIKVVADATNAVHECDETNNEKQKNIEVNGPDLIIQDITWPTGPVCLDKPVTVTVKVKNQGDCVAAGSFTVKYYVDDQYHDSDTITTSLSHGGTSTQTFSWTPDTCGNHNIKAVADANSNVHECDETNNEKQKSIEVNGPDLIIQDITWPTGSVYINKPVTLTVKVKNQGGCTAGTSTIKYYVANQYYAYDSISNLKFGSTSTQTFSWTPDTCGNHNIKAVADANNNVKECNENNNESFKSVDVKGPDLIVEQVTVSSPTTIGNQIKFTVVIKNKGNANAGKLYLKCYIDDSSIGNKVLVNGINSGQSITKDVYWTASGCGPHSFKAVADADNDVPECDEENNEKQTSFSVQCPDLLIQSISISPESPSSGQETTFTVVVKNQGDSNAKSSHAKLLIDETEVGTVSVETLNSGLSTTKIFTWTASGCGDHNIKAIADCNGDVTESNEGNNEKTGTISVSCRPPTAYIDSITPNPAKQSEDTVSFTGHGTGPDGTVVAYNWRSSKDGQLSTSDSFSKPASELTMGTHTIYFKVTDDNGMDSPEVTTQLTIVGANHAPNANAHGPYSANINEQVQFYGSGTDPDEDAITSYAWDFDNDGTTDGTQQNPTHSWSVAGTYYPTLKVKDNNGAWSEPDKCTVLISEASDYDGDITGISSDAYYSVEKPITIGVDIKNTGSIDETYKLDLKVYKSIGTISDETIDDIVLSSGGTTSEEFSISGLSIGGYSFTLGINNLNYELYDSAQGSFKVIDETAIQMIEDDADSLKDAAIGELNQMVEIVTDTTHEMVMGAGWTLISGPIQEMLIGLFASDTVVIAGITEQDVAGAGLEVSGIFDNLGSVVQIFGEKSLELKQGLYNAFREGYTKQEEFKIIQRDELFGDFIENRPLERNDKVIQLFKEGESVVSNIVESRPWFVIGPFDINGPLPGGKVSYEITLQEERDRYEDVRTLSGVFALLGIIIAIIMLIAVALAAVGTGGAALAALPGILGTLKSILVTLTLLSKYASVALMLAMILTVPHIAPEVTQEHDTALDSIEDFISQQVTSAKVTSIKTMEKNIGFDQHAKLSIELNEETSEKIIALVVSPDGRVIDMNLCQPYNTHITSSSINFPHQPGKYKMLAMTYGDMMESSIAEVDIVQVSPQISVNVYTDKTLYSSGETVTVYANFTNPLNARVDNLMYSIDVSNATYNKTGFLSLDSESSKIETLNFVPANNETYKATVTLLAGLYIVDSAETGFTVEMGTGISANMDSKEIYDPNINVTVNLTIKNIGTGLLYQGNIGVTTVDTLNNYQEVHNSIESLSVNESEEKELQCIILPKENAIPGIYRCYINIDSSTYIIPFTVSANGTIFITAQTSKLIYSASESILVDISVKDVAFNAADATVQMILTDPNGENTYFAVTGSNGDYSTLITPDSKSVSGTYNIFVNGTKEGYRVYSDKTFFIVNERTKLRCDIPLIMQLNTTDTINLFVEIDITKSVKGAFVSLAGCGFNETRITNEEGLVTFSTSSMNKTGTVNVKIEKGGYSRLIGGIEVIGEEENNFDMRASANPYPSISGIHTGTITPNHDVNVSKLYTYPCAGTGGHTESVRIYRNGKDESASWNGYAEDGHTITFNSSFTLEAGKTYNYVMKTGSYPQIHHTPALQTENGWINCTKFTDANGKEYDDWIPAIKMC